MSGKRYNGEKAIISLTSWKGRIDTTGLTIYSLLKNCPGFHIVLVLSECEFPHKEADLPRDLRVMCSMCKYEILWLKNNPRSFKKIFWTQIKYPSVPIISADDGCVYTCNYARILFNKWKRNRKYVIGIKYFHGMEPGAFGGGYGVIYPPNCFKNVAVNCVNNYMNLLIKNPNDDRFIGHLCKLMNIPVMPLKEHDSLTQFIDISVSGLSNDKQYIACDNWVFNEVISITLIKEKIDRLTCK